MMCPVIQSVLARGRYSMSVEQARAIVCHPKLAVIHATAVAEAHKVVQVGVYWVWT